jgi:hypothetical protein
MDPFAYFHDVPTRIGSHPADKIDELLPDKWEKPKKTAEIAGEELAA